MLRLLFGKLLRPVGKNRIVAIPCVGRQISAKEEGMSQSLEDRFQNLHEFIKAARTNLNRNVWDYLIGGSETETTVARNRMALDALAFRPRVLCDVTEVDCSGSLFGTKLRIPVLLAPVGSLESFEPGGGATVAKAATEFGNGMILSSVSHPGLEATAEASGEGFKIFQLYVRGDAAWVDDHFRRAIDAGYDAFCVTVDTDSYSRRERDIAKRHQRRRVRVDDARVFQARQNWRDVERYKAKWNIPLILKGIATVEDARRAVELGVDCVYVSNHGGRQLDHGLGSIDVLPEIVAAVGGKSSIIVDGGISRGTDVVKAMILGADAVSVGRLYVYGLAAAGGPGIVRLLEILENEIEICLALLGVTSFAALDKSYLCPARPVMIPHVHSAFPLLDLPRETY
jgi:isopentenyl diphosphate isomerase/L-lactate dehydrogenase-like FMN-dependent dehydrogenase